MTVSIGAWIVTVLLVFPIGVLVGQLIFQDVAKEGDK